MTDDELFGLKTYQWDSVFPSGKYKGSTILWVLKNDAAYLDWIKDNLSNDSGLINFLKQNSRRIGEEFINQEDKKNRINDPYKDRD